MSTAAAGHVHWRGLGAGMSESTARSAPESRSQASGIWL